MYVVSKQARLTRGAGVIVGSEGSMDVEETPPKSNASGAKNSILARKPGGWNAHSMEVDLS